MIAFVRGTVAGVTLSSAVVEVGGVGLEVMCTPGTLATLRTGQQATLPTSMVVREESLTLFGFLDDDEKQCFELLQTASGVGPKLAQAMLAVLAPGSLDRVFLLFPDPWPKRRHEQRRFIGKANLDRLATLMRAGAELRVASDDPVYQEWVLRHVPVHPAFRWQAQSPRDWLERPADAVETRYEKKARTAGRTPMFFRFTKTQKE